MSMMIVIDPNHIGLAELTILCKLKRTTAETSVVLNLHVYIRTYLANTFKPFLKFFHVADPVLIQSLGVVLGSHRTVSLA